MMRTLVDAGPLYAYANRRDRLHDWARSAAEELLPPVYTCEPVLTEVFWRLQRYGGQTQVVWDWIDQGALVADFTARIYWADLRRLMAKYSDQPMDFADACLVKMSELVEECRIWTTDADFKVYRRKERLQIPLLFPPD